MSSTTVNPFFVLLLVVVMSSIISKNTATALPLPNLTTSPATPKQRNITNITVTHPASTILPTFRTHPHNIPGVWHVTKIASLFGPTLAIFIYEKARDAYERYEPFVSAAFVDFLQSLHTVAQSPYSTHPVVWLSSMPRSHPNPHVSRIANEIIRITNVRLRERAVVSRIQMDDDQYEFTNAMSASDVRNTALQVMRSVLYNGSGQYLHPHEKAAVHALIASSIY